MSYFAPKLELGEDAPYQKFVAVGQVETGEPCQVKLSEDFEPFRIDVEDFQMEDAEIKPLIEKLEFIKNKKSWSYAFRFGQIEISRQDLDSIIRAMKAKIKK